MTINFHVTALAALKILIVIASGYALVRLKLLSRKAPDDLAKLILYLLLPALIFSSMLDRFSPRLLFESAYIPISTPLLLLLAFIIALPAAILFRVREDRRFLFYGMSMFQNSGYIPIPLVMSVLPEEMGREAVVLISLFLVPYSPLLWSVGFFLTTHSPGLKFPVKRVITPPFVAICVSMICASVPFLRSFLTEGGGTLIYECLDLLGRAAVPVVMVYVGCVLANLELNRSVLRDVGGLALKIFSVKMLALPVVTIAILYLIPLPNLVRLIIAIEAMAPPATNLTVMTRVQGKNTKIVSAVIFITYLLAILTMPFFIWLTTRLFEL